LKNYEQLGMATNYRRVHKVDEGQQQCFHTVQSKHALITQKNTADWLTQQVQFIIDKVTHLVELLQAGEITCVELDQDMAALREYVVIMGIVPTLDATIAANRATSHQSAMHQ
jgi:peptidyl-tRNA hydrolase